MNRPERVTLKIEDIHPYKNNNKIHNERNVQEIAKSIQEFGYLSDIGVDENGIIIYGEGRYLALKSLGYTEIEVQRITHLTDAQKVSFRIVDNKLSDDSIYNYEAIQKEIDWLVENDYESDLTMLSDTLTRDTEETLRTLETNDCSPLVTESFLRKEDDFEPKKKEEFERRNYSKGDTIQVGGLTIILGELRPIKDSFYVGYENRDDFDNAIYIKTDGMGAYKNIKEDFVIWHKGSIEDFSSSLVINNTLSLVLFKGDRFVRKRYNNLITSVPNENSPNEPPVVFWEDVLGNFIPVDSTVLTSIHNVGIASIRKPLNTQLYVENGSDVNDILFLAKKNGLLSKVSVLLNEEEIIV